MQLPTSMKKLLLWGFKMLKTENTKICPESYFPNVEVTSRQWNKSLGEKFIVNVIIHVIHHYSCGKIFYLHCGFVVICTCIFTANVPFFIAMQKVN